MAQLPTPMRVTKRADPIQAEREAWDQWRGLLNIPDAFWSSQSKPALPRHAGLTNYGAPPRRGEGAEMKRFIEDNRSWEMERPVGGSGPIGEPLGPENEWVIDPTLRGDPWDGRYWLRRT